MRLSQAIKLLTAVVVLALLLSALYLFSQTHLDGTWQPIALVNGILACVVFFMSAQKQVFGWRGLTFRFFYPSIFILAAVAGLSLLSRLVGGATTEVTHADIWAFVLVIPLVEEVVFRIGFGSVFRRYGGPIWGAYFSALLFALVHTLPTPEKLFSLQIGLPLGPFLLGLCAEWLYTNSSRLWPIYAFHAACNGTVLIFQLIDARWLDWLELFYI